MLHNAIMSGGSSGIVYDTGTFTFASDTVATTDLYQAHNLGVKPGFIVIWTDDYAGIDSENPVSMATMIGGVFLDGLGGIELQRASSSASSSNPVHSLFTISNGDYRICPFTPTSNAYGFFTAYNSSTQFRLPEASNTYWRTGVTYHYLVAEAWWT